MLTIKEDDPLLIGIDEVRRILNTGEKTNRVYKFIKDNKIQYIVIGKKWQISRESLYNYINEKLEESTLKQ